MAVKGHRSQQLWRLQFEAMKLAAQRVLNHVLLDDGLLDDGLLNPSPIVSQKDRSDQLP